MTLNKSKKVEIPQFVADWIEKCKFMGIPIIEAMTSEDIPKEISDYLWCVNDETECSDIFARAWLDGYEIAHEKLYRVILPNPNSDSEKHRKFLLEKRQGKVYLVRRKSKEIYWNKPNQLLTETEIKKDFAWAWQFAMEVEV